jgi:hypothetical protein
MTPGANVIKPSQLSLMFADTAVQVLHSRVGYCPYPQTLDKAGEACQEQTL